MIKQELTLNPIGFNSPHGDIATGHEVPVVVELCKERVLNTVHVLVRIEGKVYLPSQIKDLAAKIANFEKMVENQDIPDTFI